MTAKEYIQIYSPSLYQNSNLNTFIKAAGEGLSSSWLGEKYNEAVALKACHIYALSQRQMGEVGAVQSKSEGNLSISYLSSLSSSSNVSELDQTWFGKKLKDLIKNNRKGITTTNWNDFSF